MTVYSFIEFEYMVVHYRKYPYTMLNMNCFCGTDHNWKDPINRVAPLLTNHLMARTYNLFGDPVSPTVPVKKPSVVAGFLLSPLMSFLVFAQMDYR